MSFGLYFQSNKLIDKDYVYVHSYGAKGNGIHDDSNAILRATRTGKIVKFGKGKFLIRKPISLNSRVRWLGLGKESIIISDTNAVFVNNGSNSFITNLTFINISTPYLVKRELFLLNKPKIFRSNGQGYQPTVNDVDIWDKLPLKIRNQNVGPSITFDKGRNILVDKVQGKFMSIILNDCQNSIVRNCVIRGGRNTFGGIVINNLMEKGYDNVVSNNYITYASNSGITFINNQNGSILGNRCEYNGESGIKLYQNKINNRNASCYNMKIRNNFANYNVYDGFDLQSENPRSGKIKSNHIIYGNTAQSNSGVGFIIDGIEIVFENNVASKNYRDGLNAFSSSSIFKNNTFVSNNMGNIKAGVHQLNLIGGERNLIVNNLFKQAPSVGYLIYSNDDNNIIVDNKYTGGKTIIYSGGKLILN